MTEEEDDYFRPAGALVPLPKHELIIHHPKLLIGAAISGIICLASFLMLI